MADDLRSCIDLDECRSPHRLYCSHGCENTVPGFRCECSEGYRLQEDKQHCVAIEYVPLHLLFANRLQIGQLTPDSTEHLAIRLHPPTESAKIGLNQTQSTSSSNQFLARSSTKSDTVPSSIESGNENNFSFDGVQKILLDGLQNAVSLDFHWDTQRVFWTDLTLDTIYSAFLNGTGKRPLIQAGLLSPSGLCVDWLHELLFWTDSGTSRIELSDLDGKRRQVPIFIEQHLIILIV